MRFKYIAIFTTAALLISSYTLYVSIVNYTEKQQTIFLDKLLENYEPFLPIQGSNHPFVYSTNPQPFHLFELLYANIHAQKPDNYNDLWLAGEYTPSYYKQNWINVMKKNPSLMYSTWQLIGDETILKLHSKLGYYSSIKTDYTSEFHRHKFDRIEFWNAQKTLIRQYQKLIGELLKLEDKQLNFYISTSIMYDDAMCHDFNMWLKSKNLIPETMEYYYGEPGANNCYYYPGDLLLLTNRIKKSSPEWPPRRFLIEANKFASVVLKSIENNIQ